MTVNHHDYSRDERRRASWWNSRHPERSDVGSGLRRGRRITLIDLLLLVVMSGILLPWLLSREDIITAGSYELRLDRRTRSENLVLLLDISLPDDLPSTDGDLVGWSIYDTGGNLLHSETDLAPKAGESVEFVKILPEGEAKSIEIVAGEHRVSINLEQGRRVDDE
jgi:hypothetical protein